ncbi:PREDICTED: transmembrane emp24 domain-containing protein 10-like [Amphimedon queenslandica]|uniref:GOLD domain-containing protein n=1 Tax=Amphimedon queenslandica TaxID=400682 RepID=A0A1X7TRK5_AMPQE|nr:PREDICTED: transmembrane emp24 domain-containing protein 10-like [Amphimedon queenslandica]|eukprot:XP_003389959.1 PREDICTED: transmembrane emp24 domain-containing protein 10-like [Amphimedon queenslandica]
MREFHNKRNFLANLILFVCLFRTSSSISFHLEPDSKKCLRDEVHKNVLVVGNYELEEATSVKTNIEVIDSKGHTLFRKEEITTGKFAFTTEDYEVFDVCFHTSVIGQGGHEVRREAKLVLKHGVEAKNYDDVAKAEKLKPMEMELSRLEDLAESIVNDFAYMRAREEEMRDTNESTNTRVLYFSVFSMSCLVVLAIWQIFYLRRFFKAKKLIE